jgi:hypothetical protein
MENGLVDRSVSIKTLREKDNGQVTIKFKQKQIPVVMAFDTDTKWNVGNISASGRLQKGSIDIRIVTADNDQVAAYRCNSGKIHLEDRFDYSGSKYKIIITFNSAEQGNLKIKYSLN